MLGAILHLRKRIDNGGRAVTSQQREEEDALRARLGMRAWKLERRPHVCSLICSPATNPRGGVNGGLSALSGVAPAASLAGVTVARSLAGGTDADRTGVLIRRVGELFAGGAAALFSARVGLTVMGMVWAVRPICW